MKNQLLIIFVSILSITCYSQVSFEKGYYISNAGEKIECEIKNIDWKNNPTEFEFRLLENTEQERATIESVKEFGIYNHSKYERGIVNIDRSSNYIADLSVEKNPIFKEETLFLKVLVVGKSNLYKYEDGNLIRFFYSNNDSKDIQQLVYKKYRNSGSIIGENNQFKQQLFNNLKCEQINFKDFNRISYKKDELINLFVRYNKCNNSEVVNFEEKQKKDLFNLNLRLGLNSSSLAIENSLSKTRTIDFDNELGFRIGIETEFILPFNNDKWAIIIEPTYQYYKSEKAQTNQNVKADYKSIEIPVGLRHSFFLNNNSKIFINSSFILDFPTKSTVTYNNFGSKLDITRSSNLGFGAGYKQNDKYSLELRYQIDRDLLNSYQSYYSDYKTISVIFGYSLF
ncbi:outer membrane beta-barrel protein [Mariniflexile sp.]|uniref:outer membrane beta-barrel protein n=1 Tax=Mariniflexile sp. TaxID=1979402 RepID=UPI0035626DAA